MMAIEGKKSSLTPLLRLRQYEYEKEQIALRLLKGKEDTLAGQYLGMRDDFKKSGLQVAGEKSVGMRNRYDVFAHRVQGELDMLGRRWVMAQKDTAMQVEKTLQAKRRLEMVERILEKHRQQVQREREHVERKLLDDLAQRRSAAYRENAL